MRTIDIRSIESISRDIALLGARTTLAAVFAFHGAQKLLGWFGGGGLGATAMYFDGLGVPLPELHAVLVAASELCGALALVTGVGQRLALPPLAFAMLVAALIGHDGFDVQRGGMEYALVLAAVLPVFALVDPGELTFARLARVFRGSTVMSERETTVPSPRGGA